MADALETRDCLLADIAALRITNGGHHDRPRFRRKSLCGQFRAPNGNAAFEPHRFGHLRVHRIAHHHRAAAGNPDIVPRQAVTRMTDDEAGIRPVRHGAAENVAHRPEIGDILEHGIIGDEIFFQARTERLAQRRIGIEIKFFAMGRDMELAPSMRPFAVQTAARHASPLGSAATSLVTWPLRIADVVGDHSEAAKAPVPVRTWV